MRGVLFFRKLLLKKSSLILVFASFFVFGCSMKPNGTLLVHQQIRLLSNQHERQNSKFPRAHKSLWVEIQPGFYQFELNVSRYNSGFSILTDETKTNFYLPSDLNSKDLKSHNSFIIKNTREFPYDLQITKKVIESEIHEEHVHCPGSKKICMGDLESLPLSCHSQVLTQSVHTIPALTKDISTELSVFVMDPTSNSVVAEAHSVIERSKRIEANWNLCPR